MKLTSESGAGMHDHNDINRDGYRIIKSRRNRDRFQNLEAGKPGKRSRSDKIDQITDS